LYYEEKRRECRISATSGRKRGVVVHARESEKKKDYKKGGEVEIPSRRESLPNSTGEEVVGLGASGRTLPFIKTNLEGEIIVEWN
jgi:hypothetical protein